MIATKGRGCGTKLRHPDRAAAERQIDKLVRRGAAAQRLNAYQCKHCKQWHVGHRPKERKNR